MRRTPTVCCLLGALAILSLSACTETPETGVVGSTASPSVDGTENQAVRVIAGAGTIRSNGWAAESGYRDGTAAEALFDRITDLAMDPGGNVLIADSGNHRIRKLTADGRVETVAGSGINGVRDGPALEAEFRIPVAIAVGPDGTIFVADSQAYIIRAITPAGDVKTIAGVDFLACDTYADKAKGLPAPTPLPACPEPGTPMFRDGPSDYALFDQPASLAVDPAGNIFVADSGNHRIRKIDRGGMVSTFAGTGEPGHRDGAVGSAKFTTPGDLAFDKDGALIVAEGTRIRRISDGRVTTIAGTDERVYRDGKGSDAAFVSATGLTVGPDSHIYVTDQGAGRVRIVAPNGSVTTLAGKGGVGMVIGPALGARFSALTGIALDLSGNTIVADYNLMRLFEVSR